MDAPRFVRVTTPDSELKVPGVETSLKVLGAVQDLQSSRLVHLVSDVAESLADRIRKHASVRNIDPVWKDAFRNVKSDSDAGSLVDALSIGVTVGLFLVTLGIPELELGMILVGAQSYLKNSDLPIGPNTWREFTVSAIRAGLRIFILNYDVAAKADEKLLKVAEPWCSRERADLIYALFAKHIGVLSHTSRPDYFKQSEELVIRDSYRAQKGKYDEIVAFLQQVTLFKRLRADSLQLLATGAIKRQFPAGTPIMRQGDEGKEFFVIKTGTASVEVDGRKMAKLRPGDYCGEMSLLRSEPRTATITSETGISAYCITRVQFHKMGLQEKLEFPKRGAVGGGAHDVKLKPPTSKTSAQTKLIVEAIKSCKNLECVRLQDAWIKSMAEKAWMEEVEIGTKLIRQGDMAADYFYVVQEGAFAITVKAEAHAVSEAASADVGNIRKGGTFGELALLYYAPRSATVTATANSKVWVIARPHFKEVLEHAAIENIGEYVDHLNRVDVTRDLEEERKINVAKALDEMTFKKDDVVFKQGEEGKLFYILVEGEIDMAKDGSSFAQHEATPAKAVPFGERALESNEPRAATITIVSDTARCLVLDKISYDILLEKHVQAVNTRKFGEIKQKDLQCLGLLGCGGFGVVELVEHTSGQTYALKSLSKGYIVASGMQANVVSEKEVQMMCDSPFVIKLYETFNSKDDLYLLLELALGGELYATYNKKGLWGRSPHAKYYVAGTVFAIDHLHSKKIIFRDLKPENLLLTEQGRVKLTDMGLAKVVVGKTFTTCGTPDYFAPEVIASKGHTRAVDWWTLGIFTFELLGGHPPFEAATTWGIYQKVNKGIKSVRFPKQCQGKVEFLIRGLCVHEPHERLPMKQGDIDNIKSQQWYDGFDWKNMLNLKMEPPYVPQVKDRKDMSNFSAREADKPPRASYKDPHTGWDKNFATSV